MDKPARTNGTVEILDTSVVFVVRYQLSDSITRNKIEVVQGKMVTARGAMLWIAPLSLFTALAADPNGDLLNAAAAGKTPRVEMLLNAGANREAKDSNGRTPLMLAAQHGHAETVRLLLSKGAEDGARDTDGWTAYGLVLFSPARGVSQANREEVLKALPHPAPVRLIVDAATNPEDLVSSCFMSSRGDLLEFVNGIHLDVPGPRGFSGIEQRIDQRPGPRIRTNRSCGPARNRSGDAAGSRRRCRRRAQPPRAAGGVLFATVGRQPRPLDRRSGVSRARSCVAFSEKLRRRVERPPCKDCHQSFAVCRHLSGVDKRACERDLPQRRNRAHEAMSALASI